MPVKYQQDVRFCVSEDRTISIAVMGDPALDVTGMRAAYVASRSIGGEQVISKDESNGITIVLPPNPAVPANAVAVLNVTIPASDTEGLQAGWYEHAANVTSADGVMVMIMSGTLRLDPSLIVA